MTERNTLRTDLNAATRARHDALDSKLSPLAEGSHYGQFLRIQYAVRAPVESWLAAHVIDPVPPMQTALIREDLHDLGVQPDCNLPTFDAEDPREAWGIAWTLAGSSLGNRALLHQRRKAGLRGADRFLGDEAMPRYWTEFRPRIEVPMDDATHQHAIRGARRVFDIFLAVHRSATERAAA
jgi:heme oxygenase